MHMLDDVTYETTRRMLEEMQKCMKCISLRQSLQKDISFISQKFVYSKLGIPKFIITEEEVCKEYI